MNELPLWGSCYTCRDYSENRREVIAGPLAEKATREGRPVVEVVDEFMMAAHRRHMSSRQPLYPGGPISYTDPAIRRLAHLMMPGLLGPLKEDAT
jgi:hypothetical protein